MSLLDRSRAGQRVRLVRTPDPYTNLVPGDEGTVLFETHGEFGSISVDWDSGSKLGLVPGEDEFEVLS